MAVLRYMGPSDERIVWGVSFPHGKTVEVDDPGLIQKAMALAGFERVDAEPVSMPEPDDYPASPEPVAFDELKIPEVGSGLVPDGWEAMHWKQRCKLAKDLTGRECANGAEADAAIREAMAA